MTDLVLAADDIAAIRADLLSEETERCAVLFASQTVRADGRVRLLVREYQFPEAADYTSRGPLEAELSPEFVARVTKRARNQRSSLIFVHSHPGFGVPHFSHVDMVGELRLSRFLAHRLPGFSHSALVISEGGARARLLGEREEIRVISVGVMLQTLFDPSTAKGSQAEIFDRQVRAFGSAGQLAIQALRVGIVGLGGTGSIVAQELAHLGVRSFILIDPDVVELTNLNRLANTRPSDVHRPKVEVAARYIRAIARGAKVTSRKANVIQVQTAKELLDVDLIFCCTDSHGSRAVLQQLAYQYMIPCIDMGVTIAVGSEQITHVYGRVQLLAPGCGCLICSNLLSPEEVRRDMMTPFERQADPYIPGQNEPAPAVMSLNGTVASLAVTMMLAVVARVPMKARHVLYNAIPPALRSVGNQPRPDCYICSRSGAFARGDSWPLFGRQE